MFLLFDIGGTKTRLAFSQGGEPFGEPQIIDTPQKYQEGIKALKELVQKVSKGSRIIRTVGGIRRLNSTKDGIVPDFRLPDWSSKPLKKDLAEITGSVVTLENDTALVGLGEATTGAGKNSEIVVYITVSTGVGGTRIIGKKIEQSTSGFEPGHQIIDADWSIIPEAKDFENMGNLEAHISGTSIEKRLGKKPYEIKDDSFWSEVAKLLAYGLNNTIVHWSPDIVVLGGGMMKTPGIKIEDVKKHLNNVLKIFPEHPEIVKAELGDIGGLYGALAIIKGGSK